jgi:hypothetical protein
VVLAACCFLDSKDDQGRDCTLPLPPYHGPALHIAIGASLPPASCKRGGVVADGDTAEALLPEGQYTVVFLHAVIASLIGPQKSVPSAFQGSSFHWPAILSSLLIGLSCT